MNPRHALAVGALAAVIIALAAVLALASLPLGPDSANPGARHLIHRGAYAVFIAVTAHGVMVGTDSARLPMLAMYVAAVALVGGLAVRRVIAPPSPVRRPSR